MNKQTIITILLVLVTVAGQAQTPKDSCSIPKDSLCQERTAKTDTINCPLDKLFLLFSAMGCPKSLVRVSGRWHPIAS